MPNKPADRTKLIQRIIDAVEVEVSSAQRDLFEKLVEEFVDRLDKDETGRIKNTLGNKRKIKLLDGIYNRFTQTKGVEIIQKVVNGITEIIDFNKGYFSTFSSKAELTEIFDSSKEQLADWLGLTKRGGLVENGYLNTLLKDATIKNQIRDSMFKSIVGQKGFFEVKKGLSDFIKGNPSKTGALQQYHRNLVYDTFSQVDRTQGKIIADQLGFNYAIYEGGLIDTSREFCEKRNGKVFSREEISKFNPTVAKPPNYNPFTDLGGYGCRHHLNWVPDAVAFALRPELRGRAA